MALQFFYFYYYFDYAYWIEILSFMFQVPPDFYVPESDEDERNPDERVDRKSQR